MKAKTQYRKSKKEEREDQRNHPQEVGKEER